MFFLAGFFSLFLAADLPFHRELKPIIVGEAGQGVSLNMDLQVNLPSGQKLNQGAPSKVVIYEKSGSKWEKRADLSLNERVLIPGQDIRLFQRVLLKDPASEIAVDATVYHCSLTRGPCYIDSFQKRLKRSHVPNTTKKDFTVALIPEVPLSE